VATRGGCRIPNDKCPMSKEQKYDGDVGRRGTGIRRARETEANGPAARTTSTFDIQHSTLDIPLPKTWLPSPPRATFVFMAVLDLVPFKPPCIPPYPRGDVPCGASLHKLGTALLSPLAKRG
jgi:hypothetical protein